MKKESLCLFLAVVVWMLLGCKDSSKPIAENANKAGQSLPTPSFPSPAEPLSLGISPDSPTFLAPYNLAIACFFSDAPHPQVLALQFQEKLRNALEREAPRLIQARFYDSSQIVETAFASPLSSIRLIHKDQDWLLAIFVYTADRSLKAICIDAKSGRTSPVFRQNFQDPLEVHKVVGRCMPLILGFHGHILTSEGKKATFVLRGNPADLMTFAQWQGKFFYLLRDGKRIKDTLMKIDSTSLSKGYLVASGTCWGRGYPAPGLALEQACFPGGVQKFRLVDKRKIPLQGCSLFVSYLDFSTEKDKYKGSTAADGEFELEERLRQPLFLVVTRNVENVDLAFSQRMLVVEGEGEIREIEIDDAELDENRSFQPGDGEISKTLELRIKQASSHISKNELEQALVVIQKASDYLNQSPWKDREDLRKWKKQLSDIEKSYREKLQTRESQQRYLHAMRLVDKADEAVKQMAYQKANQSIEEARSIWPANLYEKEKDELEARVKRLSALLQEEQLPVGKARKFLAESFPSWKEEDATEENIAILHSHLKALWENGTMSEKALYNDLERWAQARLVLGELRKKIHEKVEKALESYKKAKNMEERRGHYEQHERYLRSSNQIEEIFKQMSSNK